MKKDDFLLGIVLGDSAIFNKAIDKIDLKDMKIKYFSESLIYEEKRLFFENLKDTVKGVIHLTQDDYVTDIIVEKEIKDKDKVLEKKEESTIILFSVLSKLEMPVEHIIVPFNMTKGLLEKLRIEISSFYKSIEK